MVVVAVPDGVPLLGDCFAVDGDWPGLTGVVVAGAGVVGAGETPAGEEPAV